VPVNGWRSCLPDHRVTYYLAGTKRGHHLHGSDIQFVHHQMSFLFRRRVFRLLRSEEERMTASGIFLMIFILFSATHLAAEAVRSRAGRYITKPFLLPALALYYVTSAGELNALLIAALVCGWLGDILLMIPDPQKTGRYFKPGLIAFLLGHILYIALFAAYLPRMGSVPARGWAALAIYVAAGIVGYRLIVPHAGKMLPAIVAYIVIIVLMGASTVLPLGSVATGGAVTAMAGAFIFMVSDTLNAYNRFVRELPLERLCTMGTYLIGQFLLVQGYLLF
jgi:uncharacterized membrane protein YhhN